MKRAEKAEAAMAEYVKHYPHGAFPVKSWYAHPIVLKQMMDAVEAVSYTHLDVYKRQSLWATMPSCWR